MKKAYYSNTLKDFLLESDSNVLGELTTHDDIYVIDICFPLWSNDSKKIKYLF